MPYYLVDYTKNGFDRMAVLQCETKKEAIDTAEDWGVAIDGIERISSRQAAELEREIEEQKCLDELG
jgi:hypothetical protein